MTAMNLDYLDYLDGLRTTDHAWRSKPRPMKTVDQRRKSDS